VNYLKEFESCLKGIRDLSKGVHRRNTGVISQIKRLTMGDDQGFILIGAGLPRTGTASTRAALQHLLRGDIYHMKALGERPDHQPFWKKVLDQKPAWRTGKTLWRTTRAAWTTPCPTSTRS